MTHNRLSIYVVTTSWAQKPISCASVWLPPSVQSIGLQFGSCRLQSSPKVACSVDNYSQPAKLIMNLLSRHEKKLNDARKWEMFTRTATAAYLTIPLQEQSCNVFSSLVTGFNLPLQPSQLLASGELRQKDFLCLDAAKLSLQKPYCRNKATRLNDSSLIDTEKLGKVDDDDMRQNCSGDEVASRDAMRGVSNHQLDSERPALPVNNTAAHQAAGSLKDNMHPSVSIHGHVNKSCTSSSLNSAFPLERISVFVSWYTSCRALIFYDV